ncbi:TRAP transporter large permease [Futiania mangrovi]|uniref:TRAP transporter large permease subunit n=1 Tax=Futiania mangrovi TaxID=2959716 RepID=A0A9J6PA11_9PROT|nr:TRAP transporter large permease subunit [Futiania mangrovii]MCP1334798.1 TRAP transporter large permease subunit [Futiania mangrovii]
MTAGDFLNIALILCLIGGLLLGFPVAFTLAGVSIIFAMIGELLGIFSFSFLQAVAQRLNGTLQNELLMAVPMFVFMGVMLERSRVAEEMLESMGRMFGTLRGGLGISVSIVGALLAASTGIVGATVVTMTLLSLPTMLKNGYDPKLATGSICAAGTLGQIIPPSIVLVLLGDQLSSVYQQARMSIGDFSPQPVSVGDLFAAALIPGLLLVGLYITYQVFMAIIRPSSSPALPPLEKEMSTADLLRSLGHSLVPPVILIVAVLGSILAGIATPTEAAGVGAIGATLLAGVRLDERHGWPIYFAGLSLIGMLVVSQVMDVRITKTAYELTDWIGIGLCVALGLMLLWGLAISLGRVWRTGILRTVVNSTMETTAMVFVILFGAAIFSLVFRGFGGEAAVHHVLENMPGGAAGAMLVVMLVMFLLGFILDFIEIIFIVVPIVSVILFKMDVYPFSDPVWLGVMFAINLQTSFLTPPFGFALFYLRGAAPAGVRTGDIYRGVIPFIVIQLTMLGLLVAFPELATWLPSVLFG